MVTLSIQEYAEACVEALRHKWFEKTGQNLTQEQVDFIRYTVVTRMNRLFALATMGGSYG